MADSVKVLIYELNGVELEDAVEYDLKLENLGDVDLTGLANGQVIEWNGAKFVPVTRHIIRDDIIYVSKNGNNSNVGNLSKPVLTIEQGLALASGLTPSASNKVIVDVGPGLYTEAPLTIPEHVSLTGADFSSTVIVPSNPNANLISMTGNSILSRIGLTGLANSAYYLIDVSSTADNSTVIADISMSNSANGINASSTAASLRLSLSSCGSASMTGSIITADTNSIINASHCRFQGNTTTAVGYLTSGTGQVVVVGGAVKYCNIGFDLQSSAESNVATLDLNSCTTPIKKLNASSLIINGVQSDGDDWDVSEVLGLKGYFQDFAPSGELKLRIFDELSVGLPEQGSESTFGEGDSYTNGMLVYTFDTNSYVDVTAAAKSSTGSTFTFPSTGIGNAIYVGTQRLNAGTTNPTKFFGIKADVLTAAVGGEIIAEFWNGSVWVEFNHVSTQDTGKALPFAKKIFQRVDYEHVRFDPTIDSTWVVNDDPTVGTSYHWMRFRIVVALTTAPIFEKFKIHTNRVEINPDGYMHYFGTARPTNVLPIEVGAFDASSKSPSDQDLFFGGKLSVGRIENSFQSGKRDITGFAVPFPQDIDTSAPIKLTTWWTIDTVDASNNMDLTIRWSHSNDGEGVYQSSGQAPATAPNQQTVTDLFVYPTIDEQFSKTYNLDVSDVIPRQQSGSGALFWCSIERVKDGNLSGLHLIQIQFEYTKLSNGGHL